MKKTFKIFGWIILSSFILIIVLSFFALQSSPHISNRHTVDVKAATQSKDAARRLIESIKGTKQPVIIELSQSEANGLSALSNRAFPQVVSDFSLNQKQATFDLSLELPLPSLIKYLNISGEILPSEFGIQLGNINIGSLSLSGDFLVSVSAFFVDVFVQDNLGTSLTEMVKWVRLNEGHIKTSLSVPKEINKPNGEASALLALRDQLSLFGDVEHIKFYYNSLVYHLDTLKNPVKKNRALSHYIQFVFQLAKQQTESKLKDESAIHENYSALMALALYFGSNSFELLVGDISNLNSVQQSKRNFLRHNVKLKERVDLQKHFMYSVALQLFGNTTASDTIGEFKEFLDSNPGGSGFSFADLMADRAGTRLALLATESNSSAHKVQQLLSGTISESDFMPDITGIREGITAEVFNQDYKDVDSEEYKRKINIIDSRLASLMLFQ